MPTRGDVVRLTTQVDGKGVVGKEYICINQSGNPTILFPGSHRGGGIEDGWRLIGQNEQYVRDTLGVTPGDHSGWNLFANNCEYAYTPADPAAWVREHYLGETPQPFAEGRWVTHRDVNRPVRIISDNGNDPLTHRWMVHVPEGHHAQRACGWSLARGTNTTADQRERAEAALARLGIDITQPGQDGFWWVSESACTPVPTPVTTTTEEEEEAAETPDLSKFEVITMHPSWDVCTRSHHTADRREQFEHVVLMETGGSIYYIEPFGSTLVQHNLPQAVKDRMREMGIPPSHGAVYSTTSHGIASRRHLSVEEAQTVWPIFRGPIASEDHGPWGWGAFTAAVRIDGEVKWLPCIYTTTAEVRCLIRGDQPGSRRIDTFSSEMDYARRWGIAESTNLRRISVPERDVLWLMPYMDHSLVVDTVYPDLDGAKGEALKAVLALDAREQNFVDVLTRGAARLGIQEDLPDFLTEVGLGTNMREYTIMVPVEITGTAVIHQTVRAASQAQAMQMLQRPQRGEHTINVRRNEHIRPIGIPTITG